jgi:hypothetical protein
MNLMPTNVKTLGDDAASDVSGVCLLVVLPIPPMALNLMNINL